MKKLISVVLILLILLSAMACAFAENTLTGYSDDQLKHHMPKKKTKRDKFPLRSHIERGTK